MEEAVKGRVRKELEQSLELRSHHVVCLVGPFLSGKTTLIQEWLRDKHGGLDPYYLNVNLYLLEHLQREGTPEELSRVKARARLVMQVYLEEAIRSRLSQESLLVLDAIEILLPYQLDLVALASKYTLGDKRCIICVPEDREHRVEFEFSWARAHTVRIE